MKKCKIAIIGGGSSGLFVANLLKDLDADIFLLEKNNKLGKKILASGNGKCNFTNISDLENKYNNPFANEIINKFNVFDTIEFFSNKGLIYKNDEQGRCYPVSENAYSVLDCLKEDLNKIRIILDCEVKNITVSDKGYFLSSNKISEYFDYIICCSGSLASNLGSEKAYNYLSQLDVDVNFLKGSLAPVIVKEDISCLQGTRIKCMVRVFNSKNENIYQEQGEVLFKLDSLSGIAIFNASSIINRQKDQYKIKLDISSGLSRDQLYTYIKKKINNFPNLFKGYLNDKIADYVMKVSCATNENLDDNVINRLIDNIFNLSFDVKGIYPLKESQVCSGGIVISQVDDTLQLKKFPNIYIAGELLDIDGMSGGYNMQFAWSSAGVIANSIRRKLGDK